MLTKLQTIGKHLVINGAMVNVLACELRGHGFDAPIGAHPVSEISNLTG